MARKSTNAVEDSTKNENIATKQTPDCDSSAAANEDIPKFSKEQLLKSNWYSHRRDMLTALLEDDKQYSYAAVDRLIKNFLEKKVK